MKKVRVFLCLCFVMLLGNYAQPVKYTVQFDDGRIAMVSCDANGSLFAKGKGLDGKKCAKIEDFFTAYDDYEKGKKELSISKEESLECFAKNAKALARVAKLGTIFNHLVWALRHCDVVSIEKEIKNDNGSNVSLKIILTDQPATLNKELSEYEYESQIFVQKYLQVSGEKKLDI